jgi:amidophosphoribosyltransferase
LGDTKYGGIAIAHNGNLTNAKEHRHILMQDGSVLQSSSDTEIVLHLLARSKEKMLLDSIKDVLRQVKGAYSLLILTEDGRMIGARDPYAFRPLALGDFEGCPVLASESCAFSEIGATFVRDIEAGEIVVISKDGIESSSIFTDTFLPRPIRHCLVEYVYLARPDSVIDGLSVSASRERVGKLLALEAPVLSDIVVPVPDSGIKSAEGYAEESRLPLKHGIIRSRDYTKRTFIEPTDALRKDGVRKKHSADSTVLRDKRVALVDDSVVRGNTLGGITEMVRSNGATEVHLRIASPPVTDPCIYGIDTPSKEELLASHMSVEEMKVFLKADSLAFVSLEGLHKAVGGEDSPTCTRFCNACFTGNYPEL